jgi:RNA polymerase sigma-70 factor, ECF subfamily
MQKRLEVNSCSSERTRDALMPPPGLESPRIREAINRAQEEALVRAAQGGDGHALRQLYEAYRGPVYNLALYSIGDPAQAQDVLQAVFLKVFRGLAGFRFRSSLATWIYRIAHNECRDHHRRRKPPFVPLEAVLGRMEEADPQPNSHDQHARRERERIIQQAVMQLPFKMREVVVLKYIDGLSYDDMSRVLGCAPGTVASRLNRALAELEERLRPFKEFL